MIFEKIKSEGLSHLSYFIASEGEAAVIDPRRDIEKYIELAYEADATFKYVFETHRNEDYVIGSIEIAQEGNAEIYHGPGLDFQYGNTLEEGQEFRIGNLRITWLHTPGHTDESVSYVLYDLEAGEEPIMVFTGDALFIGDVGRTDMYGRDEDRRMASNLYDSLFNKILPLGDHVIVCPAHGSGSVCGGEISEREQSTIGIERIQNPALQITDKEKFIQRKINENHFMAPYFAKMEEYNLEGPPLLKNRPVPKPMSPKEFQKHMEKGTFCVDTRDPADFGGAHIAGSYNIILDGLPLFSGWILSYDKPIILIVKDYEDLEKGIRHLNRLGYDNIIGYLTGGIVSWYSHNFPTHSIPLLTARKLKQKIENNEEIFILDVRSEDEWQKGHIEGAYHIYIGKLKNHLDEIPKERIIATLCGNGTRASLAASLLRKEGFKNAMSVLGSMKAWKSGGYPIVK
ncbi:MAG: MBL fold metallo-hydrolase [Promethearchaeota archaeon]|nr:MAG: MBL fold metallo-hydrolase [Candidatus Lokiarchaeota archaeon]